MNDSSTEPSDPALDAALFADLRRMWELADPMPPDLPDRALFALDLEQLDLDFELLRLVSAEEGLGVRTAAPDVNTITFSGPSVTVMMRVTDNGRGRRRLDGWLAPTQPLRVAVHHADGACDAEVDPRGRFIVSDLPAGMTRLVLSPTEDPQARPLVTPTVEI